MLKANKKMIDYLNSLSNKQLLDIWNSTESQITDKEKFIIRDGIMQVIEIKYNNIYNNWMDNDFDKNPQGENLEYWFNKYNLI